MYLMGKRIPMLVIDRILVPGLEASSPAGFPVSAAIGLKNAVAQTSNFASSMISAVGEHDLNRTAQTLLQA